MTTTLQVGTALEPRTIGPITQTDIVRFAGAGGDFNPLHHDPEFAARAGFTAPIAMGQMQAGILAAALTDRVGVEHLRALEVRFVAPVEIGDVLTVTGTVTEVGDGVATLALAMTKADAATVVTGTASVGVPVTP
ncbi:MaoC family dehydratase [Kribbia dieselivorans]|uniref:MaoC family dehydratase n=1 Tax=Kribbia dieselivorans TaxID=331526 RepID=UPI0008380FFF|nr:MaoC family dehydratase [Kribbia dieselivorans]